MQISFLGPRGSFSEQAARVAAQTLRMESPVFVPYQTLEDTMSSVGQNDAVYAVVPLENSIEGVVNATLDRLIFDTDLFIQAQLNLPIVQNLLVKPEDVDCPCITQVLSHPQALAQGRRFIRGMYPDALFVPTQSTSEAACLVAESGGDAHWAAVGSALAAELYGLAVLHAGIQENEQNVTQFALVSQTAAEPQAGYKMSLVFSTENKPGGLYKVLDIFALWDLNMTRIVSRPMKATPGAYVFFVDVEGTERTADLADALTMVRRKTSFFKLLGSYPVWQG